MSSIFIRSPSDSSRTGPAQQACDVEHLGQAVAGLLELLPLDVIDMLVQPERLGGRQVPPELVLLAHHQGKAAAVGVFAFPGHVAHHRRRAAGGREHAGEQFQRGRLARPVGPQKGDELARLDGQIDAADGLDGLEIAMKKSANRGPQSLLFLEDAVRFRQFGDFDDGHGDYQIFTRFSGGKYILSPSFTPKAA